MDMHQSCGHKCHRPVTNRNQVIDVNRDLYLHIYDASMAKQSNQRRPSP